MRGIAVLLLLTLGCSSKDSDQPERAEPPAPTTPTSAPEKSDDGDAACRAEGDGDTCASAAQHAYDRKRPELAYELFELACIHGNATGCSKKAEKTRTPALWYGMACRRGDTGACATADPWARSVGARVSPSKQSPGLAGARLATVYRHAVADCLAQAPAGERDAPGELTVTVTLAGSKVDEVTVEATAASTRSCLESAATRWRFPKAAGAGPHSAGFAVVPASAAPATDPE